MQIKQAIKSTNKLINHQLNQLKKSFMIIYHKNFHFLFYLQLYKHLPRSLTPYSIILTPEMTQVNSSCMQSLNTNSERSETNTNSTPSNLPTSIYKSAIDQFKQFFATFENKLQSVYEKQNYRIYLNDKFHQRIYQQLIRQQQSLHQALEESKDYKQSANRALIEEVMNLEKLKQQYEAKNLDYQQKILQNKKQLQHKKTSLKTLQAEIKSYWIYNYDITSTSMSSLSTITRINPKNHLRSSRNQTQGSLSKTPSNKENHNLSMANLKPKTIDVTSPIPKLNSIHLPSIPQHTGHISAIKCTSNYSNHQNPQMYQNATTILSKDLSLINSSITRQKLFEKIETSNKTDAIQKLDYEREKLNLLKFFKIHLKKMSQQQVNFTEKMRMEKVVTQLEHCISEKDSKLKQIQELLLSE